MSAAKHAREREHVHEPLNERPERCPEKNLNDALEQLVADIMVAVLSLEYGAVTVSVKNGQVVQLERHEKRRLPKSPLPTFRRSYAL